MLAIFPVPDIRVHCPVPLTTALAARIQESTQMFWSAPALAVEGVGTMIILTILLVAEHPLAVTTHL